MGWGEYYFFLNRVSELAEDPGMAETAEKAY